ncbi:unnamed protein product [Adineta ricciae]|uniref:N-acetyltransferase domain-containing protein n=1 Tax=Adineta ricciae TaxID=249248 RepID=A0A814HAA2_ADIRI|nr:unnamed protein product [Adineta ricciae]
MCDKTKLTEDIETTDLSYYFCNNQSGFYNYIAQYAASSSVEDDSKPLRVHKVENIINCIYSPNKPWSFYNAVLDTNICQILQESHHEHDADRIIQQILSFASQYRCPIRCPVKLTALDTFRLLRRHGFLELPVESDAYQYVDFYHLERELKQIDLSSEITISELDDATQNDCFEKKSEWGRVLCESFGVPNLKIYQLFYSDVWSRVTVGPTTPIRMFAATIDSRIVGGCHVSFSNGVACLFNVVTLKAYRGKGIGKALSLQAMICAKEAGYRYMILQGSEMGLQVYRKLGFKAIHPCKLMIKLSTVAWYFKILEMILDAIGIVRLQNLMKSIKKSSKFILLIFAVIISIIIARMLM